MGRGVAILLALSLGANVFLGGFVAGRLLGGPDDTVAGGYRVDDDRPGDRSDRRSDRRPHRGHRGPGGGRGGDMDILGDPRALPPEARDALRQSFRENRNTFIEDRRELERLQVELSSALTAEPYDRSAVSAALTRMIDVRARQHERRTELMLDIFEKLSPEDRAALAEQRLKGRDGPRERRMERLMGPDGPGQPELDDLPPPPDESPSDENPVEHP